MWNLGDGLRPRVLGGVRFLLGFFLVFVVAAGRILLRGLG